MPCPPCAEAMERAASALRGLGKAAPNLLRAIELPEGTDVERWNTVADLLVAMGGRLRGVKNG